MRGSIVKRTRKDGTAVYCLKWRTPDGKQHWKTLGPVRKRDAERALDDIVRRVNLGVWYQPDPETFGAFLDRWLERSEHTVRPSTLTRYKEALRHLEHLRPLPLEVVRAEDIEATVASVARRAPRTAQIVLRLSKQLLASARDRGQLVDESVQRLRPPRVERTEIRFLTWAEVQELASETIEEYADMVRFAALSGLRQGELFALRDRNVDLDQGVVIVQESAYLGERSPVKTRSAVRRVRISDEGRRVLASALLARRPNQLGLVFPAPAGGVWRKDNYMARVFRPAVRRAKLEPLRFHDLRHTYAALMVAAGAHPKLLQAQMGHSAISVTLNTYGHLFPDAFDDIGPALDQLIRRTAQASAEARP